MYTGVLGYFEAHFRPEIGKNFKNRLIRIDLVALKSTRNAINVGTLGCHGQFHAFYFI